MTGGYMLEGGRFDGDESVCPTGYPRLAMLRSDGGGGPLRRRKEKAPLRAQRFHPFGPFTITL